MKYIYTFIALLISVNVSAQIPADYYNGTEGLEGDALKLLLHGIIDNHVEFPYTDSGTDVWDILKETDKDPNNPENIILLYTGRSVNAAQEWNNGKGWSREHVWAKSRGDFGTIPPCGTDVHNLRPCDPSVNSARNNRWFANCSEPVYDDSQFIGCYTSSTDWVWQPRDEVKGDVARMIFYMAVRYEGDNGEPDLEIVNYLPSDNSTKAPIHALLSNLIQWNNSDPVSEWEENRNNIIYNNYQHNRNPFIDHPEFVNLIWSEVDDINEISEKPDVLIYPNPANDYITIEFANSYYTDEVKISIVNICGELIMQVPANQHKNIDISNLQSGVYIINLSDMKFSKRLKLVVK